MKHCTLLLFIGFYLYFSTPILSQPLPNTCIDWQSDLGGSDEDAMNLVAGICALRQTSDGGYIIACTSTSGISGDKTESCRGLQDFWVVKLFPNGMIQWQKTLGGNVNDNVSDIIQTSDGGYLVGGGSFSDISSDKTQNTCTNGDTDAWLVKLSSTGTVLWDKTIGSNGQDLIKSMIQTADGGYILLCVTNVAAASCHRTVTANGQNDFWAVKLRPNLTIEWQETYGGNTNDMPTTVLQTPDGGYLFGGFSNSSVSSSKTATHWGGEDFWVVKTNSIGNVLWQSSYGGSQNDRLSQILLTSDGNYLLAGSSDSGVSGNKTHNSLGNTDAWIIKINTTGGILWQNRFGGTAADDLRAGNIMTDGGYVFAIRSLSNISAYKSENSFNSSADFWVVKTDATGTIIWDKTIGGTQGDIPDDILQATDGKVVIAGSSISNVSGNKTQNTKGDWDAWVVKLGCTIFPIEMINFEVSIEKHSAYLYWQSTSEMNSDKFQIQRSTNNGASFENIGDVAAAGNSQSTQAYQYIDKDIYNLYTEKVMYRLKMLDLDGQYTYSDVVEISLPYNTESNLSVYPNPSTTACTIEFLLPEDAAVNILVYNSLGILVEKVLDNALKTRGLHQIQFDGNKYSNGMYQCVLKYNGITQSQKRLMIIK